MQQLARTAQSVIFFLLFSSFLIYSINAQTTIDGFIKTKDELKDTTFDYSTISIHLMNNKGYVKEKVEVSPESGFWLLPIYDEDDKSIYTLRAVSTNKALSIEPEGIEGNLKTLASKKNLDFYIVGYRITATGAIKVQQLDSELLLDGAPAGIQVTLKKGNQVERKSITKQDGSLSFDQVLPGNYELVASHPELIFASPSTSLTVNKDGSIQMGKPIIIGGFKAVGKVVLSSSIEGSESDLPIAGVTVYLKKPAQAVDNREISLPCTKPSEPAKGICVTTTDSNGVFEFKGLPVLVNGDYVVSAEYKKFNIDPSEIRFKLSTPNNVVIKRSFRVTGFSVRGQVLDAKDKPLAKAKLIITNKKTQKRKEKTTDNEGFFTLDDLNGNEVLDIQTEYIGFTFPKVTVSPLPSKAQIDNIKPTHVQLCGNLISDTALSQKRQVILKVADQKLQTSTKNDFCFDVPVQKKATTTATLEVLPENDQFNYHPQIFEFHNEPMKGLQIAQKFFKLDVHLKLKSAEKATVILLNKENRKISQKDTDTTTPVRFENLLPTRYIVRVEQQTVCWKSNSNEVIVDLRDKDQEILFEQIGYSITVRSSHEGVKLSSKLKSSTDKTVVTSLQKGMNSLCVPTHGVYELSIQESCFKFKDGNNYEYDTASPKVIDLEVSGYLIRGQINTPSNENVKVHITNLDAPQEQATVTATRSTNTLIYQYFTSTASESSFEIKPQSDALLFFPQKRVFKITKEMTQSGKCIPEIPSFDGKEGRYISGSVSPRIKGVKISVNSGERVTLTDDNGSFKIGPLYDDAEYKLEAELEGYSFEAIEGNSFKAHKLASITVTTQLGGVLISIVSSKHRSNTIVPAEGKIIIRNLLPDKYFIKATLKEYEFEPSSKYLELGQGKDEEVAFTYKKTGFSAFGSVKSIGNEPEPGVTIQAISKDSGEYEEATTDQKGEFRLRGLKPNIRYYITVGNSQHNIERSSPKQIVIQKESNNDVFGNDFIIFKQTTLQFSGEVSLSGDISGQENITVEIDLLSSSNAKQFKIISSQKLPLTNFFHFILPMENYLREDNTKFYVRLTSSGKTGKLNTVTHSIVGVKNIKEQNALEENQKDKSSIIGSASLGSDIQVETLSATKYHSLINFPLKPAEQSRSQTGTHDHIDQKPLFALVFILLIIAVYRYRSTIEGLLRK
ncbi:hypothetical protein FDP41_000131 [Naegleria fowleri]|uniref:ER membrane protein complex subunit 7 beta-sandwich domain-containing protein n=1 Tax=Naegleria fowleri TaxID=5763 RepID=A0A6A5CDC5_NAEFO|nr:uncharacterized protein FDP41_000131 [Naegleria fowleri]KAF0985092.1 hypothetical protein FDP41_000131 [Naegleria fowleri]